MNVGNFRLPLLFLPPGAVILIIKCMDELAIISFSLASRRTRLLVTSIHLRATELRATLEEGLTLTFYFGNIDFIFIMTEFDWNWTAGTDDPYDLVIDDPVEVETLAGSFQTFPFRIPNFRIRDWISHFLCIFNRRHIDYLDFGWSDCRFTFDSISREINRNIVKHLVAPDDGTLAYRQQLIDFYQAPRISTSSDHFPDTQMFHKLLIRNHDVVRFEYGTLTLNDLLITNSKAICVFCCQIVIKAINKYIKIWQSGNNTNLLLLVITPNREDNQMWLPQNVLDGIRYTEIDQNIETQFPEFDDFDFLSTTIKRGGYVIHGAGGLRAYIYFGINEIEIFIR